jgi:o-succinylbenzoate---CoA ligase
MTLCPLRSMALRSPEAPALASMDRTWSYRDWDLAAGGIAAWLEGRSEPGTRIGFRRRDPFSSAAWLFGIARSGCTAVILSDRDPERAIDEKCSAAAVQLRIDPGMEDPKPDRGSADLDPRSEMTILFTSGSSGSPKGVAHSLDCHMQSAKASSLRIPYGQGDRWLLSLPLWHIGGLAILFRTVHGGAAAAIPSRGSKLADSIQGLQATHLSLVSAQLGRLLDAGFSGGRLKAVLAGGGPVPSRLAREAAARGIPVHRTYGMTELCSQLCTAPAGSLHGEGLPLEGWELKIAGDGEILARGPPLFLGYIGTESSPTRDSSGWFHTGDVGKLEEGGMLHVIGRKDQMFVSGGENIFPEEIERLLCGFPGVETAVVVPVAHKEYGKRPVAFISGVMHPDLGGRLREALPGFKIPDHFIPWPEELPVQKPSRPYLQQLALRWLEQRRQSKDL